MRHAFGLMGVAAAAVLLLVSAAMNWRYGYQLGKTEFDAVVLGMASAASDGLKALLPFFIFAGLKDRRYSVAGAASLLWVVCVAFSLTSALGFASLNRADTTGARMAQVEAYKDMRTELDRLREKMSWVPEHRPVATVLAQMESMKQSRRWASTSGCTDATAAASITFCQEYFALGSEHAAAVEARTIDARMTELKARIAAAPADLALTKADPQSEILADLSGQSLEVVQIALVILVAILVELGSSLGFYVAFGQWKLYENRRSVVVARPRTKEGANDNVEAVQAPRAPAALPTPAAEEKPVEPAAATETADVPVVAETRAVSRLVAPENDIERFYKERVGQAEGCSLTATALYEDYCDWCDDLGKEPLALPTFGRQFGELGVHKAKIAGRIRYIGIKLNSGREDADTDMKIAANG